ncbi:hypothetical protein SPRA44_660016 [Serratia proteamaculans]|nr:hypothetical protein SPRA44_660016 [Serratia proteamaculans]
MCATVAELKVLQKVGVELFKCKFIVIKKGCFSQWEGTFTLIKPVKSTCFYP